VPIDFADEAQGINELFLQNSLKQRKPTSIPFSGFCLNCEEPVTERRFCDSECREQHEITLKRNRTLGVSG